jgi:hypothetical protein
MKKAWMVSTAVAFAFAMSSMAVAQSPDRNQHMNKTMEKSETQATSGPNAPKAKKGGKAGVTKTQRRNDMKKDQDASAKGGNEKVETQSTVGQSRAVGPSARKSAAPAAKPDPMEKSETNKTATPSSAGPTR